MASLFLYIIPFQAVFIYVPGQGGVCVDCLAGDVGVEYTFSMVISFLIESFVG